MNVVRYILGRFYEVRASRALKAYGRFKKKAEKYFREVGL
jgi:hypothetical protein